MFVVMTIVDLSKTLISLMLEAQQRVERYGTSDVITVETINGWAELYQELVNCCDKVAVCFGYQYTFALSCSTVHYIILVYYVIYYNVYTTREYESTFKLLLLIIGYMIVVILPVVATQMASDQWAKCQRVMARLHNTMIDDAGAAERRLVKQFIRVIKKHPLQIRFMSKMPAGIFLLPALLTVVINNVIIICWCSRKEVGKAIFTCDQEASATDQVYVQDASWHFLTASLTHCVATQMASDQWAKCQRVMARLHNTMIDDAGAAERRLVKQFIRVIKKHQLQIRFMSKMPAGIFLLPALLTVWAKCQRVMARLHNTMIDDAGAAERRLVKQFIRVIKKRPLQIRFMTKVPAGIFLLPALLTVVVDNVIILLQFNHVI
ncbi:hypothetical protein HW555_013233 [Spodoptera exigua]|uniref:Gustatory receptor n=1 Tax=Spodoptera exigua TaxID=7107 RepID=A0A835G5H8_SPOEX|nr:hypothetical protein HW555_013233 [Spodoptera exigua]